MPVFSLISCALIGDQLYEVLRIRSSLVHGCSPLTTASASIRGCTRNWVATWTAG